MQSLNKATLIGNLGKDPKVFAFQDGSKKLSFSVATSNSYKDASGEWKTTTTWHNVVLTAQKLIPVIEQKLKKGSYVYVEGQITYREYTDGSATKLITEIKVDAFNGTILVLDREQKPSYESSVNDAPSAEPTATASTSVAAKAEPAKPIEKPKYARPQSGFVQKLAAVESGSDLSSSGSDKIDDEIPF